MKKRTLSGLPFCLVFSAACGGAAAPAPVGAPQPAAAPVPMAAQPAPSPSAEAAAAPPAAKAPEPARPRAEPYPVPPDIEKIVAATDRDAHDRELDGGRHPGEFLAFLGIAPGMR